MALYALDDLEPDIHEAAFVHPDATIIGRVVLGPHSSVWPHAVIRGDAGAIRIGSGSNVQDGAVLHATRDLDTVVGDRVVIGHLAHLEGCEVRDRALIGVGAAVLHRAVIGEGATVGAGAVVTNDMIVPASALAVGVPAVIRTDRSRADRIEVMADSYVQNARRYMQGLRRLD